MARILFFVFILLLLNAIIVIAGYSQVKEAKIELDKYKNELYLMTEREGILYLVIVNKVKDGIYILASSRAVDDAKEESDRLSITLFEDNQILIPVLEGKYGKEYLYKTKNVKHITGCHIRNIKYDKGIIFFCYKNFE